MATLSETYRGPFSYRERESRQDFPREYFADIVYTVVSGIQICKRVHTEIQD
jgi:hypothetical protein